MRRRWLVAVATIGIEVAVPLRAAAGTVPPVTSPPPAINPIVLLPGSSFNPGQSIIIQGTGWPTGTLNVQICGNGGVNGSPDCDMPTSRTTQADGAGTFGVKMLEIGRAHF